MYSNSELNYCSGPFRPYSPIDCSIIGTEHISVKQIFQTLRFSHKLLRSKEIVGILHRFTQTIEGNHHQSSVSLGVGTAVAGGADVADGADGADGADEGFPVNLETTTL